MPNPSTPAPTIAWALRHVPCRFTGDEAQMLARANATMALMLIYPPRDLEEFMLPHQLLQVNEILIGTARKLWTFWIDPEQTQRARAKFLRFARRTHEDIVRLTRDRDGTEMPDFPAVANRGQSEPPSSWLDSPYIQWQVETLTRAVFAVADPAKISRQVEPALPRRPSGYGPVETPPRNRRED